MARPRFEIIEHTADAGIVAYGDGLPQVFVNAALGMFGLMANLDGVRPMEERQVSVTAHDTESLLVRWLTELLYYLDAESMLFSWFEIDQFSPTHLAARVRGERIDTERHELLLGVKAVTRHMLAIEPQDGGYQARILFDI